MKAIYRQFGWTDSLNMGGRITHNLLWISIIANSSGFGSDGLLNVVFVTYTLCALIDLPAGYVADKFGGLKALNICFALRFLGLISFGFAIHASYFYPRLIWYFMTLCAVFDASSIAFLSGSYESAYKMWFAQKLQTVNQRVENSPPLFMEAFNAAYEQQKTQLGAICANGLLILPLLKTLISNLELRVGEGMTHENVPEEMKMRFAFIQGVPLDDIEYKVDLLKHGTKRCQSLLASFKQQLNNYERACSSAKQEVGRTFDASKREGVYITETRYLNGVGPLAPYVDPDLRSPFDVVSEMTTQAAASIQETAK